LIELEACTCGGDDDDHDDDDDDDDEAADDSFVSDLDFMFGGL